MLSRKTVPYFSNNTFPEASPRLSRLSAGDTAAGTGLEVGVGVEGRPGPGGPTTPAWKPHFGTISGLWAGPEARLAFSRGDQASEAAPADAESPRPCWGRGSGWGRRAARGRGGSRTGSARAAAEPCAAGAGLGAGRGA